MTVLPSVQEQLSRPVCELCDRLANLADETVSRPDQDHLEIKAESEFFEIETTRFYRALSVEEAAELTVGAGLHGEHIPEIFSDLDFGVDVPEEIDRDSRIAKAVTKMRDEVKFKSDELLSDALEGRKIQIAKTISGKHAEEAFVGHQYNLQNGEVVRSIDMDNKPGSMYCVIDTFSGGDNLPLPKGAVLVVSSTSSYSNDASYAHFDRSTEVTDLTCRRYGSSAANSKSPITVADFKSIVGEYLRIVD